MDVIIKVFVFRSFVLLRIPIINLFFQYILVSILCGFFFSFVIYILSKKLLRRKFNLLYYVITIKMN